MVVFGCDGLDEVFLKGFRLIGELKNSLVSEYEIHPSDFGLGTTPSSSFQVANAEESKQIVLPS